MRGKLIVIEGTDCSGKETQSKLLIESLKKDGIKVERLSFPMYDTPTGKIIGGPYLGKSEISESYFDESAPKVDPKVASLYYAADRKYNIPRIINLLDNGINVVLDRYVYSNMAHQGCKIKDTNERLNMYGWLDVLEFKLLELPKPDIAIFLHMPTSYTSKLKQNRYKLDDNEKDEEYLHLAEEAYIELSSVYKWKTIECINEGDLKDIAVIQKEVYDFVKSELYK